MSERSPHATAPAEPIGGSPALIVVGVDGSESSARALVWAAEEARLRQGLLRVVMAWQLPAVALYPAPFPTDVFADGQAEAEQLLVREIAEVLGSDISALPVERVVVEGAAPVALLDQAKDATLLVVGSRGRGGFRGLLLGSTSTQLVHHAPCPVTVVRGA